MQEKKAGKATSGPWRVDWTSIVATWESGEEVQVASLARTQWSHPDGGKNQRLVGEMKFNGPLLAAAPALYEALKTLMADRWRHTVDWGPREEREAIEDECEAALALAEGKAK